VLGCGTAASARAQDAKPDGEAKEKWRDASVEDYRAHLVRLTSLTAACAKARDLKTCDPALIGPDDRIPIDTAPEALSRGLARRRMIRYGWLRVLFSQAEEADEVEDAPEKGKKPNQDAGKDSGIPAPKTTAQLLEDAEARLTSDLAQLDAARDTEPEHGGEQKLLKEVLAGREFAKLNQPKEGPTWLERVEKWINDFFGKLGGIHTRARWVGQLLTWGFPLALAVGLVWWLLQMERRWRIRLVPESHGPARDAASARDWQLWLKDARDASARGAWREAIHFLYWAAISRLESKRMWPADRARTPREYLALVAADDARKPGLGALTREFERTWYGGRPAGETEYRGAEALAVALIEGGAPAAGEGL
jgi:hypothetical protein